MYNMYTMYSHMTDPEPAPSSGGYCPHPSVMQINLVVTWKTNF